MDRNAAHRSNAHMKLYMAGLSIAGLLALGAPSLASPAATAPPCTAQNLAAAVAGMDGAAGTMHATIALVNVSAQACALPPYPRLSFTARASVERTGTPIGNVAIARGAAGFFTIAWSDVDARSGPCRPVVDAYVALASGMRLFVPLRADACRAMQQSAMAVSAARVALPDRRTALRAWENWSLRERCDGYLGMYLKGSTAFRAPAHADAMTLPAGRGSLTKSFALVFDPHAGAYGELQNDGSLGERYVLCARQTAVPYGVARASLGDIATHRGVRLGMTAAQVIRIDGQARVYSIRDGYSTVGYFWPPRSENDSVLVVLFYHNHATGIEYGTAHFRSSHG